MKYVSHAPPAALAPWVERFWTLEGAVEGSPEPSQLVVPDGRPELIVHYRSPFIRREDGTAVKEEKALLFGQLLSPIELVADGPVGVIAARLRPEAISLFGSPPAHELAGRTLPPAEVWPQATGLADRIAEAGTRTKRLRVLESLLLQRAALARRPHAMVSAAVDSILETRGARSVECVARGLGVSRRQLERVYRSCVGVSPKVFSRMVRFQHVLKRVEKQRHKGWADLAVACGYYDQAHLLRDFKRFAGRGATAYLEANRDLASHFPGIGNGVAR